MGQKKHENDRYKWICRRPLGHNPHTDDSWKEGALCIYIDTAARAAQPEIIIESSEVVRLCAPNVIIIDDDRTIAAPLWYDSSGLAAPLILGIRSGEEVSGYLAKCQNFQPDPIPVFECAVAAKMLHDRDCSYQEVPFELLRLVSMILALTLKRERPR